ncbi:MAG: peptidase S41 [Rhodospirillaceae bacterium]|jgi:carboxyl-terminal processing protease|nr:MAG: peptidase S41 [Rhodospirillaceae bacterium]PPR73083.1 MAG: putative CtpA-like serine protease [Alphaproteobacteria bacterium MarineAlpha3_Bin2]HIM77297.1 S41 family peptidase [Rhodospirillales bacterium]
MKNRTVLTALTFAVFLIPLMAINPAVAAETNKNDADTYRLLNLFGDVFERVRADYVEKPTDQEMIEAAISGMLTSLDPHSSYMNAKSFKDMQVNTRGEFGGLGIRVSMEGGYVKVISPIDDTPAFRAGIKPSDLITHLDGEQVQGMTLNQAVNLMRGKVGSDIKLTILRVGKEPFDVSITRAVIKITSVRSKVEKKVGYIRITQFNEQTDVGLKKEMAKLKKEIGADIQGYVLDLRNNPGGLLDQAVAVSNAFLNKGEIVSTRSRRAEDTQRFNAKKGDLADNLPIVVLVNGGSASASEIVAGALQDHRRAVILGTKSFGKGSVQTIMPLPGHGAMRLTTARYFTPSGRSIQAKGIDPDIVVQQSRIEAVDAPKRRFEADLRNALDNGDKGNSKKKTNKPNAAKTDNEKAKNAKPKDEKAKAPLDFQLARALDLLRGLALFGDRAVKTN